MEKHCNNSQCFKKKIAKLNLNQLNILKKIDIDNFRKKKQNKHQKKKKKIMLETL